MRVQTLQIKNFRGIRDGSVHFKKHTVLIGANNVGKTTVIEALTLLLGRDKLIRELTEHDFYCSNPAPTDRIRIVATIAGFLHNDPERNGEWFRVGRAIPKWFDSDTNTVHDLQQEQQRELCCQLAFQARFDLESLTVETIRYFQDSDEDFDPFSEDAPVPVPGKLIQQLGFYLVRTSRTWDKMFSWGSELFRRTVTAAAAQPAEALLAERDRLRAPDRPIESDPQLEPFIRRVNDELGKSFPGAKVRLMLTATDSRAVMESVSAHFATPNGPCIPAARQGSGLISMQGLMLLLELGRVRSEGGDGFIMALEEPELHLPPSLQDQLVRRVQSLSMQTIVTTHSPSVAAMADPTALLVLRHEKGTLTSEAFLKEALTPAALNWQRKFFQHARSDVLRALMQPTVLIPEGKADFHLLRALINPLMLTDGWVSSLTRPFGSEVGIVPTEDARIVDTFAAVRRVHNRVCCLVDGDTEGLRYCGVLRALATPPIIVRWHDGAMIEDVIGWVLATDAQTALHALADHFGAETIDGVVDYLKHHKIDLIAYERVAEVIVEHRAFRERAAELFGALANACLGLTSPRFALIDGVLVFRP